MRRVQNTTPVIWTPISGGFEKELENDLNCHRNLQVAMVSSRAIDNKSYANSAYSSVPFSYWSIGVTTLLSMFHPGSAKAAYPRPYLVKSGLVSWQNQTSALWHFRIRVSALLASRASLLQSTASTPLGLFFAAHLLTQLNLKYGHKNACVCVLCKFRVRHVS